MGEAYLREREMAEPVVAWLESQWLSVRPEVYTVCGICDLVGCHINPDRAAQRVKARQATALTRSRISAFTDARGVVCGPAWLPLHDDLVFVELKLSRMGEVYRQARNHACLGRSYAALPLPVAEKCVTQKRWRDAGIGILGVDGTARELLPARKPESLHWEAVLIVDRFWREMRRRKR